MKTRDAVQERTVLLASPRGFCAGVVRAIDIVNLALEVYGAPLYVRREIVHNKYVVNELKAKGVVFVDELDHVPAGGRVVFSAHGVSPEVRKVAAERQLRVLDATCPLVTKVHSEAIKYAREDYSIILIGHQDHDEVIGTAGEAPQVMTVVGTLSEVDDIRVPDPTRVAYLTQTTLSLDDTREIIERLREKFPLIQGPASEDICYATQNRQRAVLDLAQKSDVILVVGSANSSNSCRLAEVSEGAGVPAHLIDDIEDIRDEWLAGVQVVGLTAGASAPVELINRVIRYLNSIGFPRLETAGNIVENVEFALPPDLVRVPEKTGAGSGLD